VWWLRDRAVVPAFPFSPQRDLGLVAGEAPPTFGSLAEPGGLVGPDIAEEPSDGLGRQPFHGSVSAERVDLAWLDDLEAPGRSSPTLANSPNGCAVVVWNSLAHRASTGSLSGSSPTARAR
jgi:hypothetical protein